MKFDFKTASLIVFSLSLLLETPLSAQRKKMPDLPNPIQIKRKGGKPVIPEVKRNEIICFALYTVQNRTLKMTAQFYPLKQGEDRKAQLLIKSGDNWDKIAVSDINPEGWTAHFRIENWDESKDFPYRVTHQGGSQFEGLVRKNPVDKEEIVVAAFTGNSNHDRGPRTDIVKNVQAQNPDLLFFSGDQSYDHKHHTAAWLLFGRQFREIIKDRPTIAIPDDHDVGQPNLWGNGGIVSHKRGGDDGGYIMPANYVNMVQRAQTSHLPDPYDPTPVKQGITVYYTSLNVGGVDFAIIEDRKWKTGPAGIVPQQGPRADHVTDPDYDRSTVDIPEAKLLGQRQLTFLKEWGKNWKNVEMKAVLSQTIFAGGAHIHGKHNGRLLADLDSNGWPQSGRARALNEIRKCFAVHIAGDQHLATVIHHGVQGWEDSGFSFCVPSIVNFYGRWWWPLEEPLGELINKDLPFSGRYYDGFNNKLSMHAYANPTTKNYNAAGYGLIRFNKKTQKIKMECWPRHVDVNDSKTQQFPGWPVEISMLDNYSRKPMGYLPELIFTKISSPVIQVLDENNGDVVYTLRIKGSRFRPPVFNNKSVYTIMIEDGKSIKKVENVSPVKSGSQNSLEF